jgi:uncharacterized protein (DUF342 family)
MIDFVTLQDLMKKQLEVDRTIRTVDTQGLTLEAALAEAGTLLDMPVRRIDYEIVERGFAGIFGSGRKEWKIRAYSRVAEQTTRTGHGTGTTDENGEEVIIVNKDGEAFVILTGDGAMLKVSKPQGTGHRVTEAMVMQLLSDRNVKNIDRNVVKAVIDDAEGEYIPVGTFDRNYSHDSSIRIEVSDSDMKAAIIVEPPGVGGCDYTAEQIISQLKNNRVVFGFKKDVINDFVDHPIYRAPVVVAEGKPAANGANAHIEYYFKTDQSKIELRQSHDGTVDFKNLSIIQNVVQNQPVAKKIPAEEGVKGRTVRGEYIPAKDGVDIQMPLGNNVQLSEDGMMILSKINGQVMLSGNIVSVEPVYMVQGNVCLKTGNIIFLGTVVVTGNVEDGFSVKAAGNIEVHGTVGASELEAEGDIIVSQGITGKAKGSVTAGKSIWARFIENAIIDAGNMVVVSDGIINSQVDAYKRIVCKGKRARIVGGRLRASEEINAHVIGSSSGSTETVCEVGIDPKIQENIERLMAERDSATKEHAEAATEIQALVNIKAQRKSLPEDKEFLLNELMDQRNKLAADLQRLEKEIAAQQEAQNNMNTRGRVSAANVIYPGTKVIIHEVPHSIRSEYRSVTFVLEDSIIRAIKYEEPDEEALKGPEGYES